MTGHGRRDVLRYSCGHYYCGCHGQPIEPMVGVLKKKWQVKEILSRCRKCALPVHRLPPGLAQRVAEEEW